MSPRIENEKGLSVSGGKYRTFIRQSGAGIFFLYVVRKFFFLVYRYRFRSCGAFFATGSFHITGHRFIEIGRMSVGERLRMDAVHIYSSERRYSPYLRIGLGVSFGSDAHIACNHRIIIGDNVLAGSHVFLTDHDHGVYSGILTRHSQPIEPPAHRDLTTDGYIEIDDNVFIGDHCIILKNVRIGKGAVVAAGSVVTRDVPPASIVAGNPARVLKRFNETNGKWEPVG